MPRVFCACPLCRVGADPSDSAHSFAYAYADEEPPPPAAGQPSILGSQPGSAGDPVLSSYVWQGPVSYSFATAASDYGAGYAEAGSGFGAIPFAQQQAFRYILEGTSAHAGGPVFRYGSYESIISLSISEVASPGNGSLNTADIRIARSSLANPTAYAYYPAPDGGGPAYAGDVWFGTGHDYTNPVVGTYEWVTHIHELGHSFGLKHGHETDVYGALPADRDSLEFSVMTYRSYVGGPADFYRAEEFDGPQTLMMYDIAALQAMYGADFATNANSTIYTWSPLTGEMSLNGVAQGAPGGNRVFLTVWDGGGNDTYDFSNYTSLTASAHPLIDLRPGFWTNLTTQTASLSYEGGHDARGNIFNAFLFQGDARSYIENAVGTNRGDEIYGNDVANQLFGGAGNDSLYGGTGNDTLYGGSGNDTLSGGGNTDLFVFQPGASGSGNDLIVDFTPGSDRIDVTAFGYTSIADIQAAGGGMSQAGSDVILTLATGGQPVVARLLGVSLGTMTASRFVFSSGANDAPVAVADSNGSDAVVEAGVNPDYTPFAGDASARGNVLTNDTDADEDDSKTVTTTGTFSGTYGTLTLTANGEWTYALNNADPDTNALTQGQSVTDVFSYTMRDSAAATASSTLTISITGTSERPSPLATIEAVGATSLTAGASRYFFEDGSMHGPTLKYSGADVIVGQFGAWAPLGVEAAAGGGYDVVWKMTGADQYIAWHTDSSGNMSSMGAVVSGSNYALQELEDVFDQDFNSDGTTGLVTSAIEAAGATGLVAKADRYFFEDGGPSLKYLGAAVTAGQFGGGWAPIGVEAASGGYDVVWKTTGADQYIAWHTDSGGNYASSLTDVVPGSSYALQELEDIFAQDLNSDGTTGVVSTEIEADGATSLVAKADRYFFEDGGPTLKYLGAVVTSGQFGGGWAPIGVEAAGGGYDVVWKTTGLDQYIAWHTDSSGNYAASLTEIVSGNDSAMRVFETLFDQDLNSDGTTGVGLTAIEAAGATSLSTGAGRYFFEDGPTLKYHGTDVVSGQFGSGWAPIGVEAAGGGYDVIWKMGSADQYIAWHTDSYGNYASSLTGVVSGGSYAVQALEDIFAQDLNGDGTTGLVTSAIEADGATNLFAKADRYFFEDDGPALKYLGTDVVAGQFGGGWAPIGVEAAAGGGYDVVWKMAGADQYVAWHTDSSGNYAASLTDIVSGNDPALRALEPRFDQDLNGSGFIG